MKINVVGFPYNIDLENECLDLIRLWREDGIEVNVLPVARLEMPVLNKLTDLGCKLLFHLVGQVPGRILEAKEVRQGLVVGLYSSVFFDIAHHLRVMGCRLIWAGEPNAYETELEFYKQWGLCERYVVKSYFHRVRLWKRLFDFRCNTEQVLRIKPPFFPDQYEFNIVPHVPGSVICIGKVGCCADPNFYPANSWQILSRSSTPVRAIVVEWANYLDNIARRPKWVDTLPVYRPVEFYPQVHCLVQIAKREESWLRFALDAMACGAPVIAQNDSSWKELIRHGENGFLCNSPDEISASLDMLAQDENLRVEIAIRARESLFGELIDNHASLVEWRRIFEELA